MEDLATVSRRSFVRGAAALGALSALGAAAASNESLFKAGVPVADAAPEEKVTWGHCAINCPGRCSLKFHVVDDEVVWVETYTDPSAAFEDPQPRACLRGRSYRRWLASPDRLNYPMKRVGKRGEGKFERISWEEAIDTAADKLKEVIEKYGNEAVYVPYATGVFCYDGPSVQSPAQYDRRLSRILQQLLHSSNLYDYPVYLRIKEQRGKLSEDCREVKTRADVWLEPHGDSPRWPDHAL